MNWRCGTAVLDLRVRRALAHAVDKDCINEALFEGSAIVSDTLIYPNTPNFAEADRRVMKYPFDVHRTARLMADAGYTRDAQGLYSSPAEGRLSFEIRVVASSEAEKERAIMADGWRRSGFEMAEGVFTVAQSRDGQAMATFPSLAAVGGAGGEEALIRYTTSSVVSSANRWTGNNRGGWSDPQYDAAVHSYLTTLDPIERGRHVAEAARILSEQLGVMALYFNPSVLAYPSSLQGVNARAATAELAWNVHEWQWR
jgi:peptide/nickel transport system substrate-binding protein